MLPAFLKYLPSLNLPEVNIEAVTGIGSKCCQSLPTSLTPEKTFKPETKKKKELWDFKFLWQ
jgi:hypothetical protein